MAINFSDYFTKAGKLLEYASVINTARGTTIPAKLTNIGSTFTSVSTAVQNAIAGVYTSLANVQAGCDVGPSSVTDAMGNFLQQTIIADVPLATNSNLAAIQQLIVEMMAGSQTVKQTTPAIAATAGSNSGNAVMVVSAKRGDGRLQENVLAETITATVTNATNPATATITYAGQLAETNAMAADWPLGSGCVLSGQTIWSGSGSLLTNGGFESWTVAANVPDNWSASVATPGTTLNMSIVCVQTLTVSGSPSSGTYQISWTNAASKVQYTSPPLAYNASGSQVQAALRSIVGLSAVTVITTGTTPNFTHTITFNGVAGDPATIAIVNNTTGQTYTPATSIHGTTPGFIGQCMLFVSNGSELTAVQQQLTSLSPLTQYAVNLWLAASSAAPAAGVVTIDLVDGIGGSIIGDAQSAANSFTIGHAAFTTTFKAFNGVFRTPAVLPSVVYLRVRISTAVTNAITLYIDDVAMVAMAQFYKGGPSVAVFSGNVPLNVGNVSNPADSWSIAVTTDRAGAWQEWFDRVFNMKQNELLLPSVTGGAETIANSLIS